MDISPHDALTLFLLSKEDDSGARPRTLFYYRDSISRFLREVPQPEHVAGYTTLHLRNWTAAMKARGLKPGAIHTYQGAVWTWLRWLHMQDDFGVADITRKVPLFTVRDEDRQRRTCRLTVKRDLVTVARAHAEHPRRDVAIIELLWATGARRSELAATTIADYDRDEGTLQLRLTKTGKPRQVHIGRAARLALENYIIRERGGRDAGPLFYARRGQPLTSHAIRMVLHRLSKSTGHPVSSHDFRRAAASRMLEAEVPIDVVMHQLGHKTMTMSLLYGESARQKRSLSILRGLEEAG